MIHLVLDTSIYRKCPRLNSREFSLLSDMINAGHVVLHVPHVVEREFSSELEHRQEEKLNQAKVRITKALEFEPLGPKSTQLSLSLQRLKGDLDGLVLERTAAFSDWLNEHKAMRHPITLDQSQRALNAYFSGDPPLKQPKSRKDIPDAFIFHQILDMQTCYQSDLNVVVEDGALRSACENAGICCWSTLLEFIVSPAVQEFYAETMIEKHKSESLERVREIATDRKQDVASRLEEVLLSDQYAMLYGGSLPGGSGEIYLSGINTPHSIEIDDVEYIGSTVFLATMHAQVELMYEFSMDIFDALELDSDKYSTSPLNKHYVDVETTDTFQFSGRLELEFTKPETEIGSLSDLKALLRKPTIVVSELQDFEVIA